MVPVKNDVDARAGDAEAAARGATNLRAAPGRSEGACTALPDAVAAAHGVRCRAMDRRDDLNMAAFVS